MRRFYHYLSPSLKIDTVDRYQAIMRVFHEFHAFHYRDELRLEDVWSRIYGDFDDSYTPEQCRADLAALASEEYGNLTINLDVFHERESRASLADPVPAYGARKEALRIEETFLDIEQSTWSTGALSRTEVDQLLESLLRVDDILKGKAKGVREGELAETWRLAARQSSLIQQDTRDFMGKLASSRQKISGIDVEGYDEHKRLLVNYIESYLGVIDNACVRMEELFTVWKKRGYFERVRLALIEYVSTNLLMGPDEEKLTQLTDETIAAVTNWVWGLRWLESFRRTASREVSMLLEIARAISATARMDKGFLAELEAFAKSLLAMNDQESAAQAVSIALGQAPPRVIAESLTAYVPVDADPWAGEPPRPLELRSPRRGSTGSSDEGLSVQDDDEALLADFAAEKARKAQRLARIRHVFGDGEVREVTSTLLRDDDDILVLGEILSACMESSKHHADQEDGGTICLLNPDEQHIVHVSSENGSNCWLPAFAFQRVPTVDAERADADRL